MTRSAPDIDTHSAPDIDAAGLRSSEHIRTGHALPRAVLGWACAAAVVAAGGALAAVTFIAGEDGTGEPPADRSGTRAPVCTWSQEVDGSVFPANDLGPAPTPESVLVFERCDGEWTAQVAWMHPGSQQRMTNGGDDDLANPWEDADWAVEQWLEGNPGPAPHGWHGP